MTAQALARPFLGDGVRRRLVDAIVRAARDGYVEDGGAMWTFGQPDALHALEALRFNPDPAVLTDALNWLAECEAYSQPDYFDGTDLARPVLRKEWNAQRLEDAERQYAGAVARLAEVAS